MALQRRMFVGNVPTNATLNGSINNSVTSFVLSSGTGFPDGSVGPFVVTVDQGNASEEKILCTSRSGNSVTVTTRGYDGTTATSHANAATVLHTISAVDMDEANQAVVNTIGKITTAGDVLVATAANAMKRLGIGTALQGLRVNAGATDLEWATIAVATLSAANLAQIAAAMKPTVATVLTLETTTSVDTFVDLATPGPSVTVTIPSTGLARVSLVATMEGSTGPCSPCAGYVVSGANTIAATEVQAIMSGTAGQQTGEVFQASGIFWLSGLAAGSTTFKMQYETADSAGTAAFSNRTIMVETF